MLGKIVSPKFPYNDIMDEQKFPNLERETFFALKVYQEEEKYYYYSNICLTLCNIANKAFFHFPVHNFNPFLQIPELKIQFFHIYTPCLLYNMHIRRLQHYNPPTLVNVPKK
jgi:hypothetical protein